jgi:putative CocE/NonD family hydrolase
VSGFRVVDPAWIELADGCRLAARLWLPEPAPPAPAILEAIPYRRRDGTLALDHPRYAWWAERGFAGVRLDLRGSGDSDGALEDEYLVREQDDALEVIAWIAAQPWCNGRVGMVGYSWGGFAGLQVAARRPPALGAVVTVNSTVRRYTDDCHYVGGSVNAHDMLSWATTMLAFDARPPDPAVVGERWRAMWRQRLDVAPPMIERWLSHQLEDAYWRHGSVCFEYAAIEAPLLAVGGWSDPYRNAVLELVEHLPGRCHGLIGPWAHGYPHVTDPGPRIGFLQECERFFGHHLRGDDAGYDEPPLRVYVQGYDPPRARQTQRSGRWHAIARWPPAGAVRLRLGAGGLSAGPGEPFERSVAADQATGLAAGSWCPYGGPSQPLDQRPDDALSLVYESEPLAAPLELLGFPLLRLIVRADRAQALLVARLCDVAPDGPSLLVTRGVLNLAHRAGHDAAQPLEAGAATAVELRLDAAGHRFEPGHRVRLALSPAYWPWVWPSPHPVTLTVASEGGELELPVPDGASPWTPPPPLSGPALEEEWIEASPMRQRLVEDIPARRVELHGQPDFLAGRVRLPELELEVSEHGDNVYAIARDDPLSAEVRCSRRAALRRPGFDVAIEVDAHMRCNAREFLVDTVLRAFEDGRPLPERRFATRLPRADA